jgi:hypothetical protein
VLKTLRAAALVVLVCSPPSWALAEDLDGSKPLLCATIDAHYCEVGEVCYRTLPGVLGAPHFIRINFAKKLVVGPQRTTEIRFMESGEGQLLLEGTELGYAWGIALATKTGAMSTTLVSHENVFVLFGVCTPS